MKITTTSPPLKTKRPVATVERSFKQSTKRVSIVASNATAKSFLKRQTTTKEILILCKQLEGKTWYCIVNQHTDHPAKP